MIFNDFFLGLFLSILLGALIGAQREMRRQKNNKDDFAGFRTLTLICLVGFLIGFLSFEILENQFLIFIGFIGIFLMSIVAYRATNKLNIKSVSEITEVSSILSFIIGILLSLELYQISITISILVSLILLLGSELHKFAKNLTENEVFVTLKFAIISLVILPLLPNYNYSLVTLPYVKNFFLNQNFISYEILAQVDIFNFFYIWLMVVFISGIAYVGYILMRTIGTEKGIVITGILGGLMSSTALTSSYAIESKKLNYLSKPLIVGTVIASSVMFFRVIFEIAILNPKLLMGTSFVLFLMGVVGISAAIYLHKKTRLDHIKKIKIDSPFSIVPALKFAFFFIIIIFISKLFSVIFGDSGIYFIAFLSGIADVDAITITLSNLAESETISLAAAQTGIIIAAFANTLFKAGIAFYLGSKKFYEGVFVMFLIIIITGILGLFLL